MDLSIADSEGHIERNRDEQISLEVHGGELLAFGSANPRTEERYDAGRFTTYYGQVMAVIRVGTGDSLKISVSSSLYEGSRIFPIT